MKKKLFKSLIIIVIIILIVILFAFGKEIFKNIQVKLSNAVEEPKAQLEETTNDEENIDDNEKDINLTGQIKKRDGTEYETELSFQGKMCIKSIENMETGEKIENETGEDFLSIKTNIKEEKDKKNTYKIEMASGLVENVEFYIQDFIPKDNEPPTNPVIEKWPEETTIKKGRNVTITATSQDPNNDEIEYVWEGRPNETDIYSIGQHTVRVKAIDLYGAESEWSECSFEVINVEAATITTELSNNGSTNFNIKGNGNKTTYSDRGYSTVLKVNGNTSDIISGTGTLDNVKLTTKLEYINDGNYIKISYIINNQSEENKTIGIATHADIMINNDDKATITNITGNRGFYMTDGSYNYKVMLRDTANVTNVDTYWFGKYSDRTNHLWDSSSISQLVNVDSGMAYSWNNRTIAPGEEQIYTSIIGLE